MALLGWMRQRACVRDASVPQGMRLWGPSCSGQGSGAAGSGRSPGDGTSAPRLPGQGREEGRDGWALPERRVGILRGDWDEQGPCRPHCQLGPLSVPGLSRWGHAGD